MQDYMLTKRFFSPHQEIDRLRQKYQMQQMETESILPMLEVHEDYLSRALMAITQNYPSIEVYLEEALGMGSTEVAQLRARYLE